MDADPARALSEVHENIRMLRADVDKFRDNKTALDEVGALSILADVLLTGLERQAALDLVQAPSKSTP